VGLAFNVTPRARCRALGRGTRPARALPTVAPGDVHNTKEFLMKRVLITGGAGFIGSHLADDLLLHGYEVRVLDNLSEQVHATRRRPAYLSREVELRIGDVRDPHAVRDALAKVDVVCHLAAAVGVGQSMYEIAEYTATNNLGTAVLLEELARHPVERLLVASSMSLYGEGLYRDPGGRVRTAEARTLAQLRDRDWELRAADGSSLQPIPTPESKLPGLASVYALSKFDQEKLCLLVGQAYGIPTVALRFFNAYGPRQALSNPYTGVLAIFASRLLNGNAPLIFEDGKQLRDFVSVHDVVRGCRLALERDTGPAAVFNIGSGQPRSVLDVAREIGKALGREIPPLITGQYRVGDIRHCFADIGLARRELGYGPQVEFQDGLRELANWLEVQTATDRAVEARAELEQRGLTL
jgi:dTDP-L-rhamnose 4-epimerase